MGIQVFKGQTTNISTDQIVVKAPSILQVIISGVLDGADVCTNEVDLEGNEAPMKPLSWRSSLADTLAAPPLADGGVDLINISMIKFSIVNAGAGTNINLSYSLSNST